ncbi:MAG TPA: hypothetical protein PKO45_00840 [Rubrivivax sp.]|nr:hypothetical protein [Rubrivivax sp.]
MHVLIPFAAPLSEAGRGALAALRLPNLEAMLAGRRGERDEGDEFALSPPHERALARAWGWAGADGLLPFAAEQARALDFDPGDLAWGLLTPAHWHVGTDQVSMTDPEALALDEAASRQLYEAVAPLFTSEGFLMHWGAPTQWFVAHEALAELPTASLDRVIGRNVDRWLPDAAHARLLRRLLNETQMLLHAQALNEEREARGLPTVNAVWLSGCGAAQAVVPAAQRAVQVQARLRRPALAEDWVGWAQAWTQLDAELPSLAPTRITLCGERSSWSIPLPARGLLQRLSARLAAIDLVRELGKL